MYYVLEGENTRQVSRQEWMSHDNRRGKWQIISRFGNGAYVSTVFLGMDCSIGHRSGLPGYQPALFETMAFDHGGDDIQERYATKAEAIKGHHRIVAELGFDKKPNRDGN